MAYQEVCFAGKRTIVCNDCVDNWDTLICMIANNSGDNVHAVLSSISAIHDPVKLHNRLLERRNDGIFATSIGSTTVGSASPYVSNRDIISPASSDYETDTDDDATITDWHPELLDDLDVDLDALISSMGETTASKPTGVTAKHMSKVWRIDSKTAEKTLDVTTQLLRRSDDPTLSRNF